MPRLIDADALGVGRCSKDILPAAYCAGWNIKSLNMLVEVLSLNGYKLQTEVVYKPFPQNELIDHFKVIVDGGEHNA